MMVQDQLTRNERIRLEALGQANARFAMAGPQDAETVIDYARKFEAFIRDADKDHPPAMTGPLTAEQARQIGEARWASAHGKDLRAARIALALTASKDAIRRLREIKLAARYAPPSAARGPFPFDHRTLDRVPRRQYFD